MTSEWDSERHWLQKVKTRPPPPTQIPICIRYTQKNYPPAIPPIELTTANKTRPRSFSLLPLQNFDRHRDRERIDYCREKKRQKEQTDIQASKPGRKNDDERIKRRLQPQKSREVDLGLVLRWTKEWTLDSFPEKVVPNLTFNMKSINSSSYVPITNYLSTLVNYSGLESITQNIHENYKIVLKI